MNTNELKTRYREIETEMQNPDVFVNAQKMKALATEYSELKETVTLIEQLETVQHNLTQANETLEGESDEEFTVLAMEECSALEAQRAALQKQLEERLKPQDPLDKRDTIVEIRAAAGGDESALF